MSKKLGSSEAADTCTFQPNEADGRPMVDDSDPADVKPVLFTIYGPGTKQFRAAKARVESRAINRMRTRGKVDITPEESARNNAEFLADITKSIDNAEYGEGLTGRDMYVAMYTDTKLGFLAEQVSEKCGDWANFSKGSVTTSASTSGSLPG